jgi:PadR family transcriptional regulator, regulatory protein PadR
VEPLLPLHPDRGTAVGGAPGREAIVLEEQSAAADPPGGHLGQPALDGPLHGYAIIKRAAELSGGRVRLAAGTLYAALDRLTTAELVRVEREEIVNGRARRYYRLTDAGRRELEAEAARMAEASRVVTGRAPKRRPTPGARPA